MKMTADDYEQAMACMACGLAGVTPPEFFPQEPGLWDQPCPDCGQMMVWVTEPTVLACECVGWLDDDGDLHPGTRRCIFLTGHEGPCSFRGPVVVASR